MHFRHTVNDIVLLELKGYSREEVAELMNAADVCLLTSFTGGSPQFIKEAMACNRSVVATKVGDIEWLFGKEQGHYLAVFNALDLAEKIKNAIVFSVETGNTNGRKRIEEIGLDSNLISKKIIAIYKETLNS